MMIDNDLLEYYKERYHPFFWESQPPTYDHTVANECGDQVIYQGKAFILQQIIFAQIEGDRFACPHCWTENKVSHGQLIECVECGKGMAVIGGAFYWEK